MFGAEIMTLERILREASRGRCGRAKAERLKALAKEPVGVGFGSRTLAFEARLLMEDLDFAQSRIKEVERELSCLLERMRGKWLVTILGMYVALPSVIRERSAILASSWDMPAWTLREASPARP